MNLNPALLSPPIVYPECDGKPMADNTRQLRWITTLFGNLSALFHERPDVFVAADLLWYPLEGHPEVSTAPDVLVIFGRPKGDRGSYKQWEEDQVPITVAFEVLSPGNTVLEMDDKHAFYEEHGVEEYYVYDPDHHRLGAYVRKGEVLRRVRPVQGHASPRLGIRFDVSGEELVVLRPDGQRFLTFEELEAARRQAEQRAGQAEQRAGQAEQRAGQAEQRAGQAEQRADQAEQRADQAEQRADEAGRRASRLAELSREARRGQASTEELQELEQLEESPPAAGTG